MKQMLKKMALSGIANLFAEKMPFNKLIGMQVTHYDFDKV
ncbi:MAG: thioesterase family protein, partial [Aeromonas veronii]